MQGRYRKARQSVTGTLTMAFSRDSSPIACSECVEVADNQLAGGMLLTVVSRGLDDAVTARGDV